MLFGLLAGGTALYGTFKIYQYKSSKKTLGMAVQMGTTSLRPLNPTDSTPDTATDPIEQEQTASQHATISSTSLALSAVGIITHTPLTLVAIPGLIYITTPIIIDGYKAIFQEGRVRASILDSITIIAMLGTGHIFATSLAATLLTVSEKLLLQTEDKAKKSLTNIFGEQPRFVWVLRDNIEVQIPFEQLMAGDVIVVNAGEFIPVDGLIVEGLGSIDQHKLTGEAQPAEKTVNDTVFAGTVLLSGRLYIQVEQAGQDTVIAQLGHILNQTSDFKSSVQSKGKLIANRAVIPTLALSALALPIGISNALAVLNSGFGYNMRIIAPIGMLNFLNITSHEGILIKDGRSLELLSKVNTVVFDKTGTLTLEQPHVAAIHLASTATDFTPEKLLAYAAAAEFRQTHPIAKAILQAAQAQNLELPPINMAKYEVGYGIKVELDNKRVIVGSIRFMKLEEIIIPPDIETIQITSNEQGNSLVYVAVNNELMGVIELESTIRPEIAQIIQTLHQRGLSTYIISGDHEQPTQKLAAQLGIDHYFAEVLPEDKANLIIQLQQAGHSVCFVGDGINDSIALKTANVSISMRGASTIATDTAQIVLMGQNLNQLLPLFDLAENFNHNMQVSFISTIVPGVICVSGAFFFNFGIVTSIMLYNMGLVLGVSNAMLPWVQYQQKKLPNHKSSHIKESEPWIQP